MAKIVNTDNFGGDYPNEFFLNCSWLSDKQAREVADALNSSDDPNASRYWRVVPDNYILKPGFEP